VAESTIKLLVDASGAVGPLKKVTKETEKLEGATRDTNGRLRDSKGKFIGVGVGARGAAKGVNALGVALKAALLPLAGFAVVSKIFQGFQEADRAAAAVKTLGVNAKELQKQLEGVAKRSDGLASTTQLMAAAYDVASAGFSDASDNAKILEASLKGAIGGMSDVATVSDAATSVLNSYGLSADKAAKLVDGFIQTQNDGKIIVGQYAVQIGRLAPIASAAGIGIDELNAAIATTTASGVPVESTFAGLRQGIASILKPSSEAEKLAKALGIEFNAAGLKTKGFGGVIDEIKQKTGGSTTAMTTLFGSVEAVGAILPIASGNMKTFNKNLDNQRTKSGQSAKAAETMGDTVSKSVVKITNKISSLVRKLDVALGPAINGILVLIGGVIDAASAAITTLSMMFSMSKDKQIAIDVIKSGDLRGGFGRGLSGIDEIIGQDRRKELQEKAGFGGLTNPFSNDNDRDKKFLQLLRNEPKIKGAISGPAKAAAGTTTNLTTESPEVLALRKRVEELLKDLSGGSKGGSAPKGEGSEGGKVQDLANLSRDRVQSLRDQTSLAAALNEEEKRSVQLNIDLAEITRNANGFAIEDVNAQIAARIALDDKTLSAAEYNKTIEDGAKAAKTAADAQQKAADDLKEKYKQVGDSIKSNVTDSIVAAIEGTKSLGESAMDILKNLANQLLRSGINQLFSVAGSMGPAGGILSMLFGGGRASGGTVKSGTSYMVGERGPELFSPGRSGSIAPNGSLGGGANVTVNVDASGSNVEGDNDQAGQLGKAIGIAVQQELIKQKRPGGLLTR